MIEIRWEDIQVGDVLPDGSVVTQVHPVHEIDCFRIEYGRGLRRDRIVLSADHLLLCDLSGLDPQVRQEIVLGLQGCGIPKQVDYDIQSQRPLTAAEQAVIYEHLTGDRSLRCLHEGQDIDLQTLLESCEFQEHVVDSHPAVISETSAWLTVEVIHQLVRLGQKISSGGNRIRSSRYVGPQRVRCISTDSGKYESRGLVHHNSVAVRNIIMHCLTHSADMSVALIDLKQTEFTYFKGKKGVVGVANEVQEAVELLRIARDVMYKRNREMAALGITDINDFQPKEPTETIWVSGRDLHESEKVTVRIDGGEEKEMTAAELLELVQQG